LTQLRKTAKPWPYLSRWFIGLNPRNQCITVIKAKHVEEYDRIQRLEPIFGSGCAEITTELPLLEEGDVGYRAG